MSNRLFKTPLIAAFFYALITTGCAENSNSKDPGYSQCDIPTTAIATVQGSRPASQMVNSNVTVQGVVTLIQDGQGLYMEEPGSDKDATTSNAIFIQTSSLAAEIMPGAWISVSGTVTEIRKGRNTLTALTQIGDIDLCSEQQTLPLALTTLPLKGLEREAKEGMRIKLAGTLTVMDTYQLSRGKFSISGNGFQYTATEVTSPGENANAHGRQNQNFTLPVTLINSTEPLDLQSGSSINDLTGVLIHGDRNLRVAIQKAPSATSPVVARAEPREQTSVRVVGMNLRNFFNGDGKGGEFPAPRGAKTPAHYSQQGQRISAAIGELDPHILAVMELENDGFGPLSAAQDFIRLANKATGGSWRAARTGNDDTGSDKITVALFYRDDLLQASGQAQTLSGPEFRRSRQPMAQVFKQGEDGEKFLVVVNHLKSKGSCPKQGANRNNRDGQGCWNPMRTAAAEKMSAWVNSISSSRKVDKALILGDMNAYRMEEPIDAIRDAGYVELMDQTAGNTYSFIYFGQAGSLDYAFANSALEEVVDKAFIWHVNAAFPLDTTLPQPWMGFSDHDPVVVDLRLRQSSTSD